MLVLLILGMTYFLFGSRLDRPTRPPRGVGVYVVYSFVGAGLVSSLLGFTCDFLGIMSYTVKSLAVIIPVALVVWIIIDNLRGKR